MYIIVVHLLLLNLIKYKTVQVMNIEYKDIGDTLPFKDAAELRNKWVYVGSADDGWTDIVKVGDKFYAAQYGLQEHEGHVFMNEVEILSMEFSEQFNK